MQNRFEIGQACELEIVAISDTTVLREQNGGCKLH